MQFTTRLLPSPAERCASSTRLRGNADPRQAGAPSPDLSTPSSSDTAGAIRLLYGHSIAKDLIQQKVSPSGDNNDDDDMDIDDEEQKHPNLWTADVLFTNANYQAKKTVFLLFINRASHFPRIALFY